MSEAALMSREQSRFGGTFKYGTTTGPCSTGPKTYGGRLTSGGISQGAEITIVIRKSVYAGPFVVGGKVFLTVRAVESKLMVAPDGITDGFDFWEIICKDVNQNG